MTTATFEITLAGMEDAERIAPLFDDFRVFCGQESSLPESRHFLFERMLNHEAIVWMATDERNEVIGYLQLYMFFSTVMLQPMWIVGSVYVDPASRRRGVAKGLLNAAIELVRAREDRGVGLRNHKLNEPARRLFESVGFRLENDFDNFFFTC